MAPIDRCAVQIGDGWPLSSAGDVAAAVHDIVVAGMGTAEERPIYPEMTHPEAFGPLPDTTPEEGRNEDHFQTPLEKAGTKLSATSWNLEKTPEPRR